MATLHGCASIASCPNTVCETVSTKLKVLELTLATREMTPCGVVALVAAPILSAAMGVLVVVNPTSSQTAASMSNAKSELRIDPLSRVN